MCRVDLVVLQDGDLHTGPLDAEVVHAIGAVGRIAVLVGVLLVGRLQVERIHLRHRRDFQDLRAIGVERDRRCRRGDVPDQEAHAPQDVHEGIGDLAVAEQTRAAGMDVGCRDEQLQLPAALQALEIDQLFQQVAQGIEIQRVEIVGRCVAGHPFPAEATGGPVEKALAQR